MLTIQLPLSVINGKEDEAVSLLNIVFAEISQWCIKNINLQIMHPTKCKAMIISRKNFIGPLKPDYTNTTNKVLGVNIDNKLTWEQHIKVNRRLSKDSQKNKQLINLQPHKLEKYLL
jgi:hypothetical protein